MDRSSAGCIKLTAAEKAGETETPDEFGYTTSKYGSARGAGAGPARRFAVQYDETGPGEIKRA